MIMADSIIHSIHYPFTIDNGLKSLQEEQDYSDHVEQLILQVLFTSPGERVNRPDFGCGLRQMIFAPNSEATANILNVMVLQALQKWLSAVIDVNEVNVKSVNETLEVYLVYVIKARQERRYLNLEVTL
jgi:phage baseplate assembly protein W